MRRRAPHLVILVGAVIALAFGTAGPASAAPPVAARWSVTVAPASLLTGPELGGGRVYVGFGAPDGTGGVRALDVTTGATLWTRTFPLPVTVPPVFVPSSTRLYAGTSERLYGLDPATGRTIVAGPVTGFEDLYSLHYADGRVYVQTTHDIFAFTAAATPLWDYFLDDDPSVLSAPGDGFLYVNDEQDDGSGGFPQCMEKVDAAKGTLVALNCAIQDFIPPTAVPSRIDGRRGRVRRRLRLPHLQPEAALAEHPLQPGLRHQRHPGLRRRRRGIARRAHGAAPAERRDEAVREDLRRAQLQQHPPAGLRSGQRRRLPLRPGREGRLQGVQHVPAGVGLPRPTTTSPASPPPARPSSAQAGGRCSR